MTELTPRILCYGTDTPLPDTRTLQAGPLSVVYDNGDLRYVRLGEREILRRVYAAVRDHNWGTVPPELSDVQIDAGDDHFAIRYRVIHRQNDIDFAWDGTITGSADGTIVFRFDGEARSTFRRNRIGFCVLHPMDLAGQPCTITHVDGSTASGAFPAQISPDQPFRNIRAITHEVIPGVRAEVLMEGDTFEMEDQRNWTDASYKTYCTALGEPFPVTVEAGTVVRQQITVRLLDPVPASAISAAAPELTVELDEQTTPLPPIGLEVASHRQLLTPTQVERLRALNLSHLRVVLGLDEPGVEAVLQQAAEEARALDVALEVAAWVSDNAAQELADLRALVDRLNPPVGSWLIYQRGAIATGEATIRLAREHLGSYARQARIGGGTDAFFTELNRSRPPMDAFDLVSFSINPQVHAFANVDLVETLAAQAAVVNSAQAFSADRPIVVSPVTLLMRWNPNATGPQPPTPEGELPQRVDPRQMSLFGAGWTMGSLKYLAESGTFSTTYYETTGWLGIMEQPSGSPLPEKFVSVPGGVYPMYHVFAAVGAFAGGVVRHSRSSQPLVVDALALVHEDRTRVLLANYTPAEQTVTLRGLSGSLRFKSLDETNAEDAMRDPERFRALGGAPLESHTGGDGFTVRLKPFAIAQIDAR